jgi:uncharacterized membrane protein
LRDRFVWVLTLAYAVIFTWLGSVRYAGHRNFVDFGIFAQTANSAFGCFCNPIEGSHWAFHFSPILYLAGAVVWLWRTPLALIALQSVACALTIPPVCGLVERRAPAAVVRLTAVVVFLYPALAGLAFVDFHENAFAPAAVAWTLWAFDNGMMLAALVGAFVTLCVKEDQAIFLAIAGILGALRFRGTSAGRTALLVAVAGALVATLYFHQLQPAAAAAASHWAPTRFYAWTPAELHALVPRGILHRIGFIVLAFAPLLFLPFRSRMMWIAIAPLAEVLLSRMSTTFTMGSHYAGAWIGYVLVAFAFAVRTIGAGAVRRVLFGCIALCVLEFVVADPLHPRLTLHARQPRDAALDAFLPTLPADISIATQEEAYTHLALVDPYARLLPDDPNQPVHACFVLIDRDFPDSPRLEEYGAAFYSLVRRGDYTLVRREGGIELYRSVFPCR